MNEYLKFVKIAILKCLLLNSGVAMGGSERCPPSAVSASYKNELLLLIVENVFFSILGLPSPHFKILATSLLLKPIILKLKYQKNTFDNPTNYKMYFYLF